MAGAAQLHAVDESRVLNRLSGKQERTAHPRCHFDGEASLPILFYFRSPKSNRLNKSPIAGR